MLQVEHLNAVIKYFAIQISHRIEELEPSFRSQAKIHNDQINEEDPNRKQSEQELAELIQTILVKYQKHRLSDEREVEYVKKFMQRILQIFGFYKWKSKSISILNHVERQLTNKLNILSTCREPNVGKILLFIVEISRRGFVVKSSNFSLFMCPNSTISQGNRRKALSRFGTKQISKVIQNSCKTANAKKRRTASVISAPFTAAKFQQQPSESATAIVDRLYSCMQVDRNYIVKCIENEEHYVKQQLKRNKSTIRKLNISNLRERMPISGTSHRKIKTQFSDLKILTEVRNNSKIKNIYEMENEEECCKRGGFGLKRQKFKNIHKKKALSRQLYNNQNNLF